MSTLKSPHLARLIALSQAGWHFKISEALGTPPDMRMDGIEAVLANSPSGSCITISVIAAGIDEAAADIISICTHVGTPP